MKGEDVKFKEMNLKDKNDALDLLCILSANVIGLYGNGDRPERTEEQVLDECSDEVKEWWGEYLLSKVNK